MPKMGSPDSASRAPIVLIYRSSNKANARIKYIYLAWTEIHTHTCENLDRGEVPPTAVGLF